MDTSLLEQFGLTRNEAKVYLSLLKSGSTTAGKITEATGIHRRNVYDCLERLMERGLVGFVMINNRKLFEAADPQRFMGIIEEERARLNKKQHAVGELIPQLEKARSFQGKITSEISYYKGIEGVKTVFEDIFATGASYQGYGATYHMEGILRSYLKEFVRRKEKAGLRARLIYDKRGKSIVKSRLSDYRYIIEEFQAPISVRVYGDKVALMILSTEQPYAIVINHKQTADAFRERFTYLWSKAAP